MKAPAAAHDLAPAAGVLAPRSSAYCRVRLRRSSLRVPASAAISCASRRCPVS